MEILHVQFNCWDVVCPCFCIVFSGESSLSFAYCYFPQHALAYLRHSGTLQELSDGNNRVKAAHDHHFRPQRQMHTSLSLVAS